MQLDSHYFDNEIRNLSALLNVRFTELNDLRDLTAISEKALEIAFLARKIASFKVLKIETSISSAYFNK